MPASTYIYIAKYPQLENLILSFHLTFNKSKPIAQMKSGNDYRIITIILQFSQKCKRNVQFHICNHQHFHCATSKSLYKAKTFIVITLVSIIILWKHILDLVTRKIILSKYFSVRLPDVQWPEERKESLENVCTWHFQAYRESLKKFAWRISDKINYGKSL